MLGPVPDGGMELWPCRIKGNNSGGSRVPHTLAAGRLSSLRQHPRPRRCRRGLIPLTPAVLGLSFFRAHQRGQPEPPLASPSDPSSPLGCSSQGLSCLLPQRRAHTGPVTSLPTMSAVIFPFGVFREVFGSTMAPETALKGSKGLGLLLTVGRQQPHPEGNGNPLHRRVNERRS